MNNLSKFGSFSPFSLEAFRATNSESIPALMIVDGAAWIPVTYLYGGHVTYRTSTTPPIDTIHPSISM